MVSWKLLNKVEWIEILGDMSYDWSSSIDTWNVFNEYFNFFLVKIS